VATLEPDSRGLVTLTLVRGDSDDLLVTVVDEAGVAINLGQAVDGTAARAAVLRLAVKSDPAEQTNAEALVLKRSYYADEIQFLTQSGATLGQARVLVDKPDTLGGDPSTAYQWDLEVTRQDVLRSGASAGTASFTAGSAVVVGAGTAFTRAKVGDVLQPLGVLNTAPCLIAEITSAGQIVADFADWQTEAGVAFEIRRGRHRTAVRGPFVLVQDVVAQ
jgi:hypothetical protein